MSYQQFNMRCTKCSKTWTTAFGIVGTTQIATPTNKCPHCAAPEIERIEQPQSPTPEAQTITADKAALLATDLLLDNFHWSKVSDADYDIFRRELERRLMLVISPENIKRMVDRFLQWKLPDSFNPDGGITFQRAINQNRPTWPQKNEPVGTNLLDADQAEEMVRYMLAGLAQPTPPEQRAAYKEMCIHGITKGRTCADCIRMEVQQTLSELGGETMARHVFRTRERPRCEFIGDGYSCNQPQDSECHMAAHPEAVRMPPRPEVYTDSTRNYRPRLIKPGQESAAVVYIEALEAELQTERAAHERTRGELEQLQQSKLRMFVWDGRGKYKVVSCANSVSEARALALEEMSLRGDLLNMREHVEHEQPLIYHRANAELTLTVSGETEELNICLEAETKRRQTAEADLESLRSERE